MRKVTLVVSLPPPTGYAYVPLWRAMKNTLLFMVHMLWLSGWMLLSAVWR